MIWTARIEGAISFSDLQIEDNTIKFPENIDSDYKWAILTDKVSEGGNTLTLMVSKDAKEYSLAVCIVADGKQYTADDLGKMMIFRPEA